jgi:hypothetical protein
MVKTGMILVVAMVAFGTYCYLEKHYLSPGWAANALEEIHGNQ